VVAQHLVRFGVMGHVGLFASPDATRYPRDARVICRTSRGLELGEVLYPLSDRRADADGTLLRGVSVEDDLLLARLQQHREEAFQACRRLLRERQIAATLVDVEHLFDGQSLFFYFLGETTPELDAVTAELAQIYEAKVQFQRFADSLEQGCGPGCGTSEAANGCSSGGCSTCSVVDACRR
jgi:cell fate regulator YaaT (PSP1 superfamily)